MSLQRIADYEILQRVSTGFVYKARDVRDGTLVALKVLPAWQNSAESLTRFEREIKVERSISHENLVRFHDVGQAVVSDPELVGSASDGSGQARVFFLAREWIEGRTLEEMLKERRLPLALALSIIIQVADGLGVVHAHGIVHRDVNPSNVQVTPDGDAKILDFGLVKILEEEMAAQSKQQFRTASGQMLGTAPFLAPEQVRAEKVDARTDLFAVGVLLYHMVTGAFPFPHSNLLEYFHAIDSEAPRPLADYVPDAPPELDRIIGKLLAKAKEDRYQTAADLISDLSDFLSSPHV